MKQRYTKRIVAFVLALAMVLTGGAFSTVFNTASASAASKKATLKLKKKVSITAGKKVTLKIKKKNVKKIKSQKWTTSKNSGARNLASNLIAEDGSVGIRVTNEGFSKRLCQQFRKAIVSTSANISGQPSPANYSEITEELKSMVDYVVGYRREEMGHPKPSSIIKLDKGGVIKIIRE